MTLAIVMAPGLGIAGELAMALDLYARGLPRRLMHTWTGGSATGKSD